MVALSLNTPSRQGEKAQPLTSSGSSSWAGRSWDSVIFLPCYTVPCPSPMSELGGETRHMVQDFPAMTAYQLETQEAPTLIPTLLAPPALTYFLRRCPPSKGKKTANRLQMQSAYSGEGT